MQPSNNNRATTMSSFSSVVNTACKRYEFRNIPAPVMPPACDTCKGTGYAGYNWQTGDQFCTCITGQETERRERQAREQIRAEQADLLVDNNRKRLAAFSRLHFLDGNVPSLKTLESSDSLAKVQGFSSGWNGMRSLLLTGKVGVGKTQMALGFTNDQMPYLREHKLSVRIVTVPDLMNELRAGFDDGKQQIKEGYDDMLNAYRTCGLLVLDDLGAEKLTAWVKEQFYLLFDHRYRQQLPIIATSNFSFPALRERLGGEEDLRVWDRIRQTFDIINVTGENQRDAQIEARRKGGTR